MPDMLVRLYDLPPLAPALERPQQQGITIQRALAPDQHVVVSWVKAYFSPQWGSECAIAFTRQPVTCYLAVKDGTILGFACHEATCKNFFGPTGVIDNYRGHGLGKALLLACLHDMAAQGYAYAIIGGVGPADFYQKVVGATLITNSDPGIFARMVS